MAAPEPELTDSEGTESVRARTDGRAGVEGRKSGSGGRDHRCRQRNLMAAWSQPAPIQVTLAAWKEQWPGYRAGLHQIVDWQWYGVVHGRVCMSLSGTQLELGPGDSVLIPPGTLRQPASHGDRDPAGYFWVIFTCQQLALEEVAGRVLEISPELEPDLDALVAELRTEERSDSAALIQALVTRLVIGLWRRARSAPLPPPALNRAAEREVVASVRQLIANRLHEPLSRAAIAAHVHVSEAHLARLFRAETGMSIGSYLTQQRLERAKKLLLSTSFSISRIAGVIGYESYSHFTQLFRRTFGVTPSAYRRARGQVWLHGD